MIERRVRARKSFQEPARRVPVAAECDVCVVGGGCTGVFAAVAAARCGAKTTLVEAGGCFGGVATRGLVNIWHSLADTPGERAIIAGLTAETLERLRRRGAVKPSQPGIAAHFTFNTAELQIELDEMVSEARVRPFLHARFVAPLGDGGRLRGVVIEDKSGRRAISASCFIDATGDADVVARMGLPCYTRERLQPPTTCAILQGLAEIARRTPDFHLSRAVFNPRFKPHLKPGTLWARRVVGATDCTMVAGTRVFGANCADADDLTRAEIEGRRQVRVMCDLLRKHFDGGRTLALIGLSAAIGIRETRHARCLHALTERDVLNGRRFDDAVANGTYPVDIHCGDGPGIIFRRLDGTEVYAAPDGRPETRRWRPETPDDPTFYQVPYRALVPRGAENVLVAGRAVDADEGAFGAIRVMVNCNQLGQAAGVAAYLALQHRTPVCDVDPARLRRVLRRQGAAVI